MLYNEQNRNGRWYNGRPMTPGEADGWYAEEAEKADAPEPPDENASDAPADGARPAAPYFQPDAPHFRSGAPCFQSAAPSAGKRVSPVWRVVAIAALCLLAGAGIVLRILGPHLHVQLESAVEPVLPFAADGGDSSASGAGIPDDADMYEYFDSYFTSSSDIDIPAAPTGTGVTLTLESTAGAEKSLQDIYAQLSPAVVGITCYRSGEKWSWGTGVVFTTDGYVVTNAHVLEGSDAADVIFPDGDSRSARFVGSDTATDLAVLKIEGENFPCAAFADSASCQVGDGVVAIGNPLGEQYAGTMTNGIISAINRSVSNKGFSMTLLQTNAALNEGNSGGPLINMHGQVVGITNMKVMFTYSAAVEGIGFAIPTSVIKPVVDAIVEYGYVPGQPTLGIVAGPVSEEAMERYGLPSGIYVSRVDENSDAFAQGMQAGDVITAVNGTPVASVDDVNAIKDALAVGDEICCTVYREGKSFDIRFRLVDKGVIG